MKKNPKVIAQSMQKLCQTRGQTIESIHTNKQTEKKRINFILFIYFAVEITIAFCALI